MTSTLLLAMYLAAAPTSAPLHCTAANAKSVTFRFIDQNAASVPGMCVKVTGYLLGTSLFASKAAAKQQGEPDWRMIGLDGKITPSQSPTRVTVFGRMEDCGSAMLPSFCHYVGGSVIRDAQIAKFELTTAHAKELGDTRASSCHFGDPAILSCMNKQIVRSETHLNSSYKATMARLSMPARVNLRTQQRSWLNTRYDECAINAEEENLGAQTAINYNNCVLLELGNRTLWLDHYKQPQMPKSSSCSLWTERKLPTAAPI